MTNERLCVVFAELPFVFSEVCDEFTDAVRTHELLFVVRLLPVLDDFHGFLHLGMRKPPRLPGTVYA